MSRESQDMLRCRLLGTGTAISMSPNDRHELLPWQDSSLPLPPPDATRYDRRLLPRLLWPRKNSHYLGRRHQARRYRLSSLLYSFTRIRMRLPRLPLLLSPRSRQFRRKIEQRCRSGCGRTITWLACLHAWQWLPLPMPAPATSWLPSGRPALSFACC